MIKNQSKHISDNEEGGENISISDEDIATMKSQ